MNLQELSHKGRNLKAKFGRNAMEWYASVPVSDALMQDVIGFLHLSMDKTERKQGVRIFEREVHRVTYNGSDKWVMMGVSYESQTEHG